MYDRISQLVYSLLQEGISNQNIKAIEAGLILRTPKDYFNLQEFKEIESWVKKNSDKYKGDDLMSKALSHFTQHHNDKRNYLRDLITNLEIIKTDVPKLNIGDIEKALKNFAPSTSILEMNSDIGQKRKRKETEEAAAEEGEEDEKPAKKKPKLKKPGKTKKKSKEIKDTDKSESKTPRGEKSEASEKAEKSQSKGEKDKKTETNKNLASTPATAEKKGSKDKLQTPLTKTQTQKKPQTSTVKDTPAKLPPSTTKKTPFKKNALVTPTAGTRTKGKNKTKE
eukprot:TRINITY_DN3868_c0_g1_i4.p1 TRINITY_DN3868_c0_g1~~TRINITY_DN3868_c0_g1_i4.p1  ORF type:complete len:281 (-),score=65.44 TRINITY_DN3868_c0_g1_i4:53-895(-)